VAVLDPSLVSDLVDIVIGDFVYELQFRVENSDSESSPRPIDMDLDFDPNSDAEEEKNKEEEGEKATMITKRKMWRKGKAKLGLVRHLLRWVARLFFLLGLIMFLLWSLERIGLQWYFSHLVMVTMVRG